MISQTAGFKSKYPFGMFHPMVSLFACEFQHKQRELTELLRT